MNLEGFAEFLKRGGRSPSAVRRCLALVAEFERYVQERQAGAESVDADMLQAFVDWVEREPKASAKFHLWALCYYFEYLGDEELRYLAGALRQQRIERRPFPLKDFRGVDPEHVKILAAAGVKNVKHMLKAGRTPQDRHLKILTKTSEVS